MHETVVVLKDGTKHSNPIYCWRPKEGWFQLYQEEGKPELKFFFRDCQSIVTKGQRRTMSGPIEDADELVRAREDGWDGN